MLFSFTQISYDYCQKSYNGFWGFLVISTMSQLFLIHAFVTIFLEIARTCILFFYFSQNERNITTSLLMIHLKCTIVHYANLNSRSKNKLFLNYGLLNMLFRFFDFLFMFILNFCQKTYNFLIQISKIHFKMKYITEYLDVKPCDTKMWY